MLLSVPEIDNLNRARELLLAQRPNPCGSVAEHDASPGPHESALFGLASHTLRER